MVQAQPHEIAHPKTRPNRGSPRIRAVYAVCSPLALVLCALLPAPIASCDALPHGRLPASSEGGLTRVVTMTWEGAPDRLGELLAPLSLRVFIIERPDPDWVRVELLDLRDRPVALRLHRLGRAEDGADLVEARCFAGRLGDPRLEVSVLDALEGSGG